MLAAARQLSPFDRRRLDEHLAGCGRCSDFYQDMTTLSGVVATLEPAPGSVAGNEPAMVQPTASVARAAEASRARMGRHAWWQLAAACAACFACGVGTARTLARHAEAATPKGASAEAVVSRGAAFNASRPERQPAVAVGLPAREIPGAPMVEEKELRTAKAQLQAKYEAARAELESVRAQNQQSTRGTQDQQAELTRLRDESAMEQALLAHNKTLLTQAELQLEQARNSHAQDAKLIATREDQLRQLSTNVVASSSEASEDRRLNEAFRLMGQRNLHVVDVYDNNTTGQRSTSFGRVFYSEGGPMMFVAFDLPGHGDGDKTIYHAWGQTEGSSKKPLQLGTFTKDEGASQRWVMRVSDGALLKQVDAVFITADHGKDVGSPSGVPLLYAYLRQVPNHP